MVTEEEKKTLALFSYLFFVSLVVIIFDYINGYFLKLDAKIKHIINNIKPPPNFPISLLVFTFVLLFIIITVYMIAYFVLAYQSAKILKKYEKTKLAPKFWLFLFFVPYVNLIVPCVLWLKNNNLLRDEK